MPTRLVALDLGGVLVDVDHGALARITGRPASLVEKAFFGGDRHLLLSDGRCSSAAFLTAAASALELPASTVEEAWAAMVTPRPGAAELIATLAKAGRLAVWSNTDAVHFAALEGGLGLRAVRGACALSFELGAAKPDLRYFHAALQRAKAAPSEVVFFDDREDNVAAARALGIEAFVASSVDDVRARLRALLAIEV